MAENQQEGVYMVPINDKGLAMVFFGIPAAVAAGGFFVEKVFLTGAKELQNKQDAKIAKYALVAFAAIGAAAATLAAGAFASLGTVVVMVGIEGLGLFTAPLLFSEGLPLFAGLGVAAATIPYHVKAFKEAFSTQPQ